MYTIIALATLALAGMSQAAGSHLESALKNENVAAGVGKNGVRSIKLDGDRVQLKPRDGGAIITLEDPELHKELTETSLKRRAMLGGVRSVGFSRINNIFRRQTETVCGLECGDNECEGNATSTTLCSCLKDCGGEGEECFSTCIATTGQ